MSNLEITAGQEKFSGYYAGPTSKAKGALVIVQEIYGVNKEVRRVVDVFARPASPRSRRTSCGA